MKHTHLKRARLPIPPLGLRSHPPVLVHSESRAENGTRTRDPDLGKVVLYQLSYFRNNSFYRSTSLNAVAKVILFFVPANFSSVFFQNHLKILIHPAKIVFYAVLPQYLKLIVVLMYEAYRRMADTVEYTSFDSGIMKHVLKYDIVSYMQFFIKPPT